MNFLVFINGVLKLLSFIYWYIMGNTFSIEDDEGVEHMNENPEVSDTESVNSDDSECLSGIQNNLFFLLIM